MSPVALKFEPEANYSLNTFEAETAMISRSSLDDLKPLHLSALIGWPIFFVHESRHRAIEVFREIQAHQICLCRYLTLERLHMQSARAHALLDAQGRVSGNFGLSGSTG